MQNTLPTGHSDRTAAIVEQINRRHSESREVTVKEFALPDDVAEALRQLDERLKALEEKCLAFASFGSAFDGLSARIKALEGTQPRIADNDAVAVPKAFGDLVEKVTELAQAVADLEEGFAVVVSEGDQSTSISVTEEGSTELANEVADLTATTMRMFHQLLNEINEVRRRTNKIDGDVVDLTTSLGQFAQQRAG
jgi:hypothetical protein